MEKGINILTSLSMAITAEGLQGKKPLVTLLIDCEILLIKQIAFINVSFQEKKENLRRDQESGLFCTHTPSTCFGVIENSVSKEVKRSIAETIHMDY